MSYRDELIAATKARRARMQLGPALPVVKQPVQVGPAVTEVPSKAPQRIRGATCRSGPRQGVNRKVPYDPACHVLRNADSIRRITDIVAAHFSILDKKILGRETAPHRIRARRILFYVAYQAMCDASQTWLAEVFGISSSSANIFIKDVADNYPHYQRDVEAVMAKLGVRHGPNRME